MNILYLLVALVNCIHATDIYKTLDPQNDKQLLSILFCGNTPDTVLQNNKTYAQERFNALENVRKLVCPSVIQFIQDEPQHETAQAINRSINLIASRMGYLMGNNSPILNQQILVDKCATADPLSSLCLFTAEKNKDLLYVLLPYKYFLDKHAFLQNKFGEHGNLIETAAFRSVEQLGISGVKELMYLMEGKLLTDEEANTLTQGTDALIHLDRISQAIPFLIDKIKNVEKTEIIDPSDVTIALLETNPDNLENLKKNIPACTTSISQISAILQAEKCGCASQKGGFRFDCNDETQTLIYALAFHGLPLLQNLYDQITSMKDSILHIHIDPSIKTFFNSECDILLKYINRTKNRYEKINVMLASDSKYIARRAYGLSNLYGAAVQTSHLDNNARNNNFVLNQSMHMYNFSKNLS